MGQHHARQALSLCRLIKYCKRKYMSQKAYYCQLLLRNQISLVDVRSLQKKVQGEYCFGVAAVQPRPPTPHGHLFPRGNLAEAPIFTRVLSSGLPRHLTSTSIGLLFQKETSDNKAPRDDLIRICQYTIFFQLSLIATLQ